MRVITNKRIFLRLEPLLARIDEDRRAVLCPMIGNINSDTMQYHGGGGHAVGGFWWSGHFSWHGIPDHEAERRKAAPDTMPIR